MSSGRTRRLRFCGTGSIFPCSPCENWHDPNLTISNGEILYANYSYIFPRLHVEHFNACQSLQRSTAHRRVFLGMAITHTPLGPNHVTSVEIYHSGHLSLHLAKPEYRWRDHNRKLCGRLDVRRDHFEKRSFPNAMALRIG